MNCNARNMHRTERVSVVHGAAYMALIGKDNSGVANRGEILSSASVPRLPSRARTSRRCSDVKAAK